MNAPENKLRIAVMALLPKEGTPVTVRELARLAGVTPSEVSGVLVEPFLQNAVDFDLRTDSFSARRQGIELPQQRHTAAP